MYKNTDNEISWCTICNRICLGHRHYKITDYRIKADLTTIPSGANYFGGEDDCKAQGGGGINEKITRIRRLREYALELEEDKGTKTKTVAINELVEETWNAPLQRSGKKVTKIRTTRIWNIPTNSFPENIRPTESTGPVWDISYPDAGNPDLFPIIHPHGDNASSMNEVDNVIQFRHRLPNGSINNHTDEYIGIDNLFRNILKERLIGENRGRCWNYSENPSSCKARMYPAELEYILDHVVGISEDDMRDYRKQLGYYKKAFGDAVITGGYRRKERKGRKTRRQYKGGEGDKFTIGPAILAECIMVGGTRKTRRNKNRRKKITKYKKYTQKKK